jgi:lipopolysaccharide heptosyltransferase II
MNILQILPELNVGGVETGTLDLARHLVRLNHKAVVVSAGGELVQELEAAGAIHYTLPVNKKSGFAIYKLIPRLAEIITREQIDIVHARSRVPAWIAYFACRRTRAVFITTCHGYYDLHPFSRVMGWSKRVIVLSQVIARRMIDDFGVPLEKIRLVPRSVDMEKFKFLSPEKKRGREFNVGVIARLSPLKGHAYFIKAMARVSRSIPRLKIWIVGDAPRRRQAYKEEIQVLVKRLGLWHCTEFLGTQRDIPQIMSQLDLLVLPTTTHEAFGRVVIEAQASGVPVVATQVGGVIDIIDDKETGLLVPPADPNSMSAAILEVYKDTALVQRLAENAYKKVQSHYTLDLMVKNTLDVYKDALSCSKILIIKLSSLGDIILSTAGLRAIRQRFKENARISFLVGSDSKDVLLRCPYIDELLVADFKNKDRGFKGLLALGTSLRKKDFDIVIDLQNNRKSHLLSFLSLCPDRYGYANKKGAFLLNHRVRDEGTPLDPVSHQFRILKMLGIDLVDPRLELWPTQEDQDTIDEMLKAQWLAANQRIVGINLSASRRWETKNWPVSHIARVCEELSRRDLRVVVTGTLHDLARAEELINMVKTVKPINACGKTTINQLACLIKKCACFISVDTSALHVASAVQTPLVALFGPTDPARHMPLSKDSVVIKKDVSCAPCYKPQCKRRRVCMELITPEEVLEAVDKLIK